MFSEVLYAFFGVSRKMRIVFEPVEPEVEHVDSKL